MGKDVFIHKTAIIEKDVKIGAGTSVWDNVHIRKNAEIGKNSIIGGKTYIAYDVKIGNLVKINSSAYICAGVTIKDKVMISAGTIFTNDRFPRSVKGPGNKLYTSGPTEETEETLVEEGVTIGAGAVIGCGITLGKYCMIGMGSVVTKNVPPHALVYGVPAVVKGYACYCGQPLKSKNSRCTSCKRKI
ncbi:MAG: N-acetyltransferase [Candidatus Omnitrophica bacterium]|nr:N-acetyltransferase [Candidatus Omnitrophota bacterium]